MDLLLRGLFVVRQHLLEVLFEVARIHQVGGQLLVDQLLLRKGFIG